MTYVLIHWIYGRGSMEAVVSKMNEPCGILAKKASGDWYEYSKNKGWSPVSKVMKYLQENDIINWGNSIFHDEKFFRLNSPSSVSIASNKTKARRVLQSAGVIVPRTWFHGDINIDFPVIARPSHHHAGKHFFVLNNLQQLRELQLKVDTTDWYFSAIFNKTHEYRVHCAHGKILMISDKPLLAGELRANHAVVEDAWRALKWSEFNPLVCEESLKAIEAVGLDYGAVDTMYNAETNSVAICEINTSPSITTTYTSGKYAAYFDWVIRNKFPAHFLIDGKSVFYNELLRS